MGVGRLVEVGLDEVEAGVAQAEEDYGREVTVAQGAAADRLKLGDELREVARWTLAL